MSQNPQSHRQHQSMYERYLRTDELLSLQTVASERRHPDELIFQVVHQTCELWWKVAVESLDRARASLCDDDFPSASRLVQHAVAAHQIATSAMRQLNSMAPSDFLVIRAGLGDGSGGDSPGFRAILRTAPVLWDAFVEALTRRGTSLLDVYRQPRDHPWVFECAEALTDFDEAFHLFRAAHLKLAQRHLGRTAVGTGGTPMAALERTLGDMLFPALWEARDHLLSSVSESS